MSPLESWVLAISFLGVATILIRRDIRENAWKRFTLHVVVLLGLWLAFGPSIPSMMHDASQDVRPKGGEPGTEPAAFFVAIMYGAMLLGMLASYAYKRFSHPETERPDWDWGLFLAPVFVSPIIFIPLYTMIQESANGSLNSMLLLIAFQNGFLWKEYFDQKRKTEVAAVENG